MSTIGKLTKESDGYKVVLERHYPVPVSKLWKAITDPEMISAWFLEMKIDLRPGGEMKFIMNDDAKTVMTGKVLRVEHEKVFEYLWENTDGPNELAVWQVESAGRSKSKLTLTYSRVSDQFGVSVAAGWQVSLDYLGDVLAGRTAPSPRHVGETPEIAALKKQYAAQIN